ncbi:MAG: CinA family protein [Dehalococcoidia bacterium]|nr:CinA family protein [Dehalococcoidia bacterium]
MSMVRQVGLLLRRRALTLAVAESCTGGLLASRLTDVSGSSAYFRGGVVSYSDDIKVQVLEVSKDLIVARGAVSSEVALAMAKGVRRLMRADIAVAVTGIAGPTGATLAKPVGLVYVAVTADDFEECHEFHWQGTRIQNKRKSAEAALALLHDYLTSGQSSP